MSAATPDWQPGDPLYPAHNSSGAGGYTSPIMTAEERAEALAADDGMPPPWWRPEGTFDLAASSRCVPCGVRWRGPEPCWMCGEEPAA